MLSTGVLPPAPDRPAYTTSDAARYARTTRVTAKRWVEGYDYKTKRGTRHSGPVAMHRRDERYLTFNDLVEVAAIASAIRQGVSLRRIRVAIAYARDMFAYERPLLLERFKTDGRSLWLIEATDRDPIHINASEVGQIAWPHIADVLRDLEYEEGHVARWWPAGRDKPILIDPAVGFGSPILLPSGVRTDTVYDRFMSDENIDVIAGDYDVGSDAILEVVRFENRTWVVAS